MFLIQSLSSILNNKIKRKIAFLQKTKLDLDSRSTLVRNLLETLAIYNFIQEKNSQQRAELFLSYTRFAWYSHFLIKKPTDQVINSLNQTRKHYPYGFAKYFRLIRNRACKLLIHQPGHKAKQQLAILTSSKPTVQPSKIELVAEYMSQHLITKLPFPSRITFGKSITAFVLKYTPIQKTTYWLLADLSHGIILDTNDQSNLNHKLNQIIKKIKSRLI